MSALQRKGRQESRSNPKKSPRYKRATNRQVCTCVQDVVDHLHKTENTAQPEMQFAISDTSEVTLKQCVDRRGNPPGNFKRRIQQGAFLGKVGTESIIPG